MKKKYIYKASGTVMERWSSTGISVMSMALV